MKKFQTIHWDDEKDSAVIINQLLLPAEFVEIIIKTPEDMFDAIKQLKIRGAPAIGIAAAYGVVLGISASESLEIQKLQALKIAEYLSTTRPTAVNLSWAISRMKSKISEYSGESADFREYLLEEAKIIHQEDVGLCEKISENGSQLIKNKMRILTHCNAGALATGGRGTALGILTKAKEQGKNFEVYVDETRPLLQGARLTTWELEQAGIPYKLITDNSSGHCFQKKLIDLVIVGADRIARNGDTANKIGTFMIAVLAKYHNIPLYIAAPSSTFDLSISSGSGIQIEEREAEEVKSIKGVQIAPANANVFNPAFDVTPAELITGLITEQGIIYPLYEKNIELSLEK